jgi:hypothetical protein
MLRFTKYAFMQNVVKLAPFIKPCIILGVILFLVYDR